MPNAFVHTVDIQKHLIDSAFLNRLVTLNCYLPSAISTDSISLLLINDGQDLETMEFEKLLAELYENRAITPLMAVGIHCSQDRKNEYGTAGIKDYLGRGAKAASYTSFVMKELLPFLRNHFKIESFKDKSFAGFSLGGLSALDIVWNQPHEFLHAGIFSGALWWRDLSQEDPLFEENKNRIMHRMVRAGKHHPWLRFFFEAGTLDETADRNNNGIIDSIDDTLDLIKELQHLGYPSSAIHYLELQDGRHDVATWKKAFPEFLKWGWGS